jgi:group I intron endonuclease
MYLYRIVNTINGIQYIGQSVNVEKRWQDHRWFLNNNSHHNEFLQNAWKKYGEEAFRFELIAEFQSRDELNAAEAFHIETSGSMYPNGYNLVKGGDAHEISESTRTKISDALKRHYEQLSEAEKQKYATFKGKTHSDETKAKISTIHKGKTVSEEAREKMSASKKGKPLSAENRAKLSTSLKRYYEQLSEEERIKLATFKGKTHSAEAKAKISDARKKYWEQRKQEKNTDIH